MYERHYVTENYLESDVRQHVINEGKTNVYIIHSEYAKVYQKIKIKSDRKLIMYIRSDFRSTFVNVTFVSFQAKEENVKRNGKGLFVYTFEGSFLVKYSKRQHRVSLK